MKSPALAAMLSIFPGLGQMYNGQFLKGMMAFLLVLVGVPLSMWAVGLIIIPVVWIWSIVDAYHVAEKLNLRPAHIHSCAGCAHPLIGLPAGSVHCPYCGRELPASPPAGVVAPH